MIRSSVVVVLSALALLAPAATAWAVVDTAQYPDLRTLPPRDLRLDRTDVSVTGTAGTMHNVLRFSNTVVNEGDGPLMLQGIFATDPLNAPAVQHLYDAQGNDVGSHEVGEFTWHQAHQHFHFVDWGRYELWTASKYDAWVAAGRPDTMAPDISGSKTTSCIEDEEFIATLPASIWPGLYQASGCGHGAGTVMTQGLSVGWGDTYDWYRQDQWIDLDQQTLPPGRYVLRSVADPFNHIYESPGKADDSRESPVANEAITRFGIDGAGQVVDGAPPTGTVFVNGVDKSTDSSQVTVRLIGRDDVSGVAQVRVSNDGTHWATYDYGGDGSVPMVLNWDLSDSRYGGSYATGTHTVYAQFLDRAGNWGPTETDTIGYTGGDAPPPVVDSAYAAAVRADGPVSWWRLGEASGPVARDAAGPNDAAYDLTAGVGAPGLLASDADTAVHLDGHSSVDMRAPTGLEPTVPFSLEAWIRPEALPSAGSFASVATRTDSYSLQFNGPKLEWTVIQNGARRRLQAAAGAVQAGQTYHVVGTYDGTSQRLFINGQQVGIAGVTGPIDAGFGMHIGSWSGGDEEFTGTIDEVAFYHQALPGLQITRHYDAGHAATVGIATPTGLTATASSGRVDLKWTDNATNETGYVVQRATGSDFSGATSTTLPAGATTYADTGLAAGTTYWYRVKATTASDSSAWSAAASASTPVPVTPPPAAPTGLTATASASDHVDVAWADNASNETGYVLERASGSDFASPTDISLPAGSTSYSDTGRVASTTYWYRVRAVGAGGPSAWTDGASATTPAVVIPPPAAPSGLTASAGASDRVDVAWADNASNETGYVLERASGSDFAGAADIALPAGATSYGDTGRTASTTYWYRVRAVGDGGPSGWSDPVSATTPGTATTQPADYAPAVLADSPVGYWRLDETTGTTARDERRLHNGLYLNGPTLGAPALLGDGDGHAVGLDGVNDRVAVPAATAFTLGKTFTLEAWVRPAWLPADGSFASLVTRPESYSLQFNGARMEFTVIQDGVRRRLQAPAGALQPGGTYHVVGTYNGARQRLYVNGQQIASRLQTGPASAVTSSVNIGSWDGTGEFLGGVVDEVAVYRTTLSADRVLAHYDAAGTTTTSAASLRRYVPRRRTRNAQARTRAAVLRRLHRHR